VLRQKNDEFIENKIKINKIILKKYISFLLIPKDLDLILNEPFNIDQFIFMFNIYSLFFYALYFFAKFHNKIY